MTKASFTFVNMVLTKASFAFVNRGGDLAKACSKHPDRPSATMCHQCHRPVCKTCTIVTPHGSFCSSECSIQNREFKERMRTGEAKAPSGGMAIKLFLFLLLVILGVAGIHMAAKKGIAPARSIDIIGILFEKVEAAKSK